MIVSLLPYCYLLSYKTPASFSYKAFFCSTNDCIYDSLGLVLVMCLIILDDHVPVRFNEDVDLVSLLAFDIYESFIIMFTRIIFYVNAIALLIHDYVLVATHARLGFFLSITGPSTCSCTILLCSSIPTLVRPFCHGKILFSLISIIYVVLMIG